ncbi:TBC1 domain family member 19 isoform X2 [Aplysia californica]|uniref:TBC1 domain family member 19 isoform X2 n=1 Tax=Aplysia californica TaxID=6500 RepID=A0ABM0K3I5_APLCA|nr:TBC1 domain family member 19 isoform X2 [Aplysia californica]
MLRAFLVESILDSKMGSVEQQPDNLLVNVLQFLRSSTLFNDLLISAQEEAQKTSLRISELKKGVQNGLGSAGWDRKLRNAIYHFLQSQPKSMTNGILGSPEQLKEPLTYVRKAQLAWEKKILKSLNSMCTELTIPLARRRPEREQKDMMVRWTELGVDGPDLSQIRPVYAPKDFLEVVVSLQNPNCNSCGNVGSFDVPWGLIQVPMKVKTLNELRLQYSDMAITQCQTGVDDLSDIPAELFDNERTKLGRKVLSSKHAPISREFSKKGCPVSMRAELWSQILGVELDQVDHLYYEQLKAYVLQHDLLVDNLLYKDVKLTATNDDQYFVFEDFLYQVLLPFSRDTVVLKHFTQNSATPPKSYIRGKLGVEEFAVTYPPNGVIPFHGFAMYVAPMCYLYDDVVQLYFVFRKMYMHFFFRLHSVSSHPQGIVSLSLLFEHLLQAEEPELFYHLKQVGCQPLKIAFKWLMRAFSGFLASDQVLLLWDRVLAYDSLEILPVLAVAIFSFRKTNLMRVTTFNAAEAVLADLFTLQVLPLLQLALFSK